MKKKIIYGLLFAVAMVTASSSFVSCKDYEGDDYAHWQNEVANGTITQNSTLADVLTYEKQRLLSALQDALANATTAADQAAISTLIGQVNGINWDPNSTSSMLSALQQLGQKAGDARTYTDDPMANLRALWNDSLAKAFDSITTVRNIITTDSQILATRIYNDSVTLSAKEKADSILISHRIDTLSHRSDSLDSVCYALADTAFHIAKDSIYKWYIVQIQDSLKKAYDTLHIQRDSIDSALVRIERMADSIAAHTLRMNQIEEAYRAADKVLQQQIDLLNKDVQELKDDVDQLKDDVDQLKEDMDKLKKLLKQEITGITIQNVWNPMFGSIALPLDVQSNILVARYGEASQAVEFPIDENGDGWAFADGTKPTAAEMPTPRSTFSHAAGVLFNEEEGNAGRIYLTVNPSNVDFSGATFSVNKSNNDASVVTLGALAQSNEELKWGLTRSANGFYVANATIQKSDLANANFKVDQSAVAEAVKDVVNNWSTPRDIDKHKLANAIYANIQQDLPRLGVQATWTDELSGEQKTYVSRYDLAATALKAPGFGAKYFAGNYSSYIVKVRDKITGKINSTVQSEIASLLNLSLGLGDMPTEIVLNKTDGNNIIKVQVLADGTQPKTITLPEKPTITGNPTITYTYKVVSGQNVIDGVNVSLDGITINYNPSITYYAKGEVIYTAEIDLSDVATDINKMLSAFNSVQPTINAKMDQIKKHINAYKDYLIDKINLAFSPLVKAAADPSRFIMPYVYAAVNNGDAVIGLSADYLLPTHIKAGTSATSGIALFPTSPTAEMIVPAYKKYIAVTHVTKAGVEQTGIKNQINNLEGWNEVIDGSKYNVGSFLTMPLNSTMQGCDIEILVEYLGYDGKVVAKKFYITVD